MKVPYMNVDIVSLVSFVSITIDDQQSFIDVKKHSF